MRESLYDIATSRNEKINNLGFDYKGKILKRTISPYIYTDPERATIIDKFDAWLYFLVEKVKRIKTYYNYTVPPDYKKIN